MEFTGERYVPSLDGGIKYEHLHRYAICLELVTGKNVLDLASGEGYGSALMAQVAQSVIGVDIDGQSIEYAKTKYGNCKNLKFLVGSCDAVPLPDESVDVVASFETIEHHNKHEEMMQEIKRVLKPGGLLIISSPNRLTHTDEVNHSNQFHVKELYYDQLVDLLSRYFDCCKIYGQRLGMGSFVFPLENACETCIKTFTSSNNNLTQRVCSLESPLYFVAICSDRSEKLLTPIDSLYIDASDDLLKTYQFNLDESQRVLHYFESQLKQTEVKLQHAEVELQKTQADFQSVQQNCHNQQVQLEQLQEELTNMKSDNYWKIRNVLLKVKNRLKL